MFDKPENAMIVEVWDGSVGGWAELTEVRDMGQAARRIRQAIYSDETQYGFARKYRLVRTIINEYSLPSFVV